MTALIRCDFCQRAVEPSDVEVRDSWIHVKWAGGARVDYCTAACAIAGIDAVRTEGAALLLDEESG